MTISNRVWHNVFTLSEPNEFLPIRQVYAWLITLDNYVVIVSKDGDQWQLPGGKPEPEENAMQTAIREVQEETGIDITTFQDQLRFFGEYTVNEGNSTIKTSRYRQVRSLLRLPMRSDEVERSPLNEDRNQQAEDVIRFVQIVPVKDILNFMPWLETTEEYKALKSLIN